MQETIYYDNEGKKYFVVRDGKRKYLSSVTEIINRFCFQFTPELLDKAAEKKARATKKTKEAVLLEWSTYHQKQVDKGNDFHDSLEDKVKYGAKLSTATTWAFDYTNPYSLPDGTHREVRVFSIKYLVSARIDELLIVTRNGEREVHIKDYKTGALYDYKSNDYGDPYRMTKFMRKLPDSPVGKAIAQLSCYGYLLAMHGFKVATLSVQHQRDLLEEPKSQMLKLVADGLVSLDGITVQDCYHAPYKIKEAFLLFSNNRANHSYESIKGQEEHKFANVWSE